MIKRKMGITHLLKALDIPTIEEVIKVNNIRLYENIFKANIPARELLSVLLAKYMISGKITKGTLLYRVVNDNFNPLKIILDLQKFSCTEGDVTIQADDLIDSLRYFLNNNNYNKNII